MTSGHEALVAHAPEAARALDAVEAAAWREASTIGLPALAWRVATACSAVHGLPPLGPPAADRRVDGRPPTGSHPGTPGQDAATVEAEGTAVAFAEQFATDVSAISAHLRAELFEQLGSRAASFTAVVFVMDVLPRTRAGLDALCPAGPALPAAGPAAWADVASPADVAGVWDALDTFTRAVPRLDALDPVTTELVRLRGARQHACRLCSSLRSRPALRAGADDATFAAIDAYADSDLSALRKAVLSFTDAFIWTPGRIDAAVVAGVAASTTEAQRVELVLDITRNALNKVAVALGADAAHVEDGVEIYDIDERGDLVYGVDLG
jgi:alkylhydroperoxidase family enzyme